MYVSTIKIIATGWTKSGQNSTTKKQRKQCAILHAYTLNNPPQYTHTHVEEILSTPIFGLGQSI